jgi:hypothetical protein
MTERTYIASCHCGGMQVQLPAAPAEATECNCTFCSRTGALWSYYKPGEITVLKDETKAMYSAFGNGEHYFCSNCGMQVFGKSPDWQIGDTAPPKNVKFAVNLRMAQDLDLAKVVVTKLDGRNLW